MTYARGKDPARPDAASFKFGAFFNATKLPTPPLKFGHFAIKDASNKLKPWGILANDVHSDCIFAGAAHETMVFNNAGGRIVNFADANVLADYAAVTGYDGTPATDQGGDMVEAASYRRKIGVLDATGVRHKIDSYVALLPGDVGQLALAAYLTGAVGVGLSLPRSADDQFDEAMPWSVIPGDTKGPGHYVPCIGRNGVGNFLVITWGRLHAMTPEFYHAYCDEALAYISLETLTNNLSPEGFNAAQLGQNLAALAA